MSLGAGKGVPASPKASGPELMCQHVVTPMDQLAEATVHDMLLEKESHLFGIRRMDFPLWIPVDPLVPHRRGRAYRQSGPWTVRKWSLVIQKAICHVTMILSGSVMVFLMVFLCGCFNRKLWYTVYAFKLTAYSN